MIVRGGDDHATPEPANSDPRERVRREEIENLYDRARTLDPKARLDFLQTACRDDPGLREEVVSLLEQAEDAEAFFERLTEVVSIMEEAVLERRERDRQDPAVRDISVGDMVGHYRILGRVGRGGMGTVYRAHDTRLDRDVALKFLPPHLSARLDAEERLLVEARAAAALEHSNVCTVHEIGETDDGRPFIAMAFCEGDTLKDRLRRGPLSVEEAVSIALQIARGLAAAHARGIVHRDVKPGNVMLMADGTVKLLDFGLAKVADVTLTRPGMTPGTMAYMSPEQARGDPVDPRTDLWSLGVVIYEMLTGVRSFRGGNDRALLQAILHEDPEPVSERRPETPEALSQIVDRLLRKDAGDRYTSAGELLCDLARVVPPLARGALAAQEKRRRTFPAVTRIPLVGWWMARLSTRQLALGITAVIAAIVLLFAFSALPDTERRLSISDGAAAPPAIAVLPFSVHGGDLEVWREGMVDLLSTGLDGAGGLRAIASRTVIARWKEEVGDEAVADLPLSFRVARRAGASYALVGSAVAAGPQIRLVADVYDLASGRSVGQAQVQGSPDSILALVDRLGMQVLSVVFKEDPDELPAIDLAGVTTTSLPALKAFLDGEVHFRRTELVAAIEAWERAIRADTLFALAYLGLSEAYAWDETRDRDRAQRMLDRALRLADRLPAREAILVRAKWGVRNGRLEDVTALEEAVREYSADAEAWYNLGEAYHHLAGTMRGPEEVERAFRRAAELQPASAPYRAHLLDLAFEWRPDSARISREIEALGRLAPEGVRTRAGRIAFALAFGDPSAREQARAALDTLGPSTATQVYFFLRHPRFAGERERVHSAIDVRLDDQARAYIGFVRFYDLSFRDGRIRRALSLLDDPRTPDQIRHCGPLSLSVRGLPVPEEILERTLSVSRADSSSFDDLAWVTCAAVHAAERGRWRQHAALLSHAQERAGRHLAAGDSASVRDWDRFVREGRAHGLWRQGRKVEALHGFESLLSTHATASWLVWYVGLLRFELGRFDEAERAFRGVWNEPLAHLYLGRIYERTGRPAEALEAYDSFASAWRRADPELQPLVREARQAITRLSGAAD